MQYSDLAEQVVLLFSTSQQFLACRLALVSRAQPELQMDARSTAGMRGWQRLFFLLALLLPCELVVVAKVCPQAKALR